MGSHSAADIDAHLCAGGTVVAASDRAARALVSAFHQARRAEGRQAWESPHIYSWNTFIRLAWEDRISLPHLVLNAAQELALWRQLIAGSGHTAAVLEGPRRNLAALAMRGHALLCSHAPDLLEAKARGGWDQDCAAFSRWLSAFDALCSEHQAVSANRLPLELVPLLQSDLEPRPDLLLVGFDRLEPVQATVFDAWGSWTALTAAIPATVIQSFAATDQTVELATCAAWCKRQLEAAPQGRLLILAQDVQDRRGEFERAFLSHAAADPRFRFEFSLGVPLAQTAPVRSAQMLLRWLDGEVAEHEVDWLVASPCFATQSETAALQARMRAIRNRGLQRANWTLRTFLDQRSASAPLPETWVHRMQAAQAKLRGLTPGERSPLEWVDAVPQLLDAMGWPGRNSPTSGEFQAMRRWQDVLDNCGSLGFDGAGMRWQQFLSELTHAVDETLFAPESENAPILIAGPAEAAGLTADAIWFLGASEDAWPARGDTHPLLPIDVQRRTRMPHASAQLDWDLARDMTARIVASASAVIFSYARQSKGVEMRPSKIAAQFAGAPQHMPPQWMPATVASNLSVAVEDVGAVPFIADSTSSDLSIHLRGGAGLLTAQSNCAFKAFATGRLGAKAWEPAQAGLTPSERGQLLHAVLHSIWGGPPDGIRSSRELQMISNLPNFVLDHVRRAMADSIPPRVQDEMPSRYLELEATRLVRLITEWLTYEKTRVEFDVIGTEIDKTLNIGALSLKLRLDRLDRLNDGSLLVIDYKTGNVSPKAWDLPRPEDVQLPLYAGFGIDTGEKVGGLAFAKVRPGDICFAGRVGDAKATLDNTLRSTHSLVKHRLEAEQLIAWREQIEDLARDFLAGRADVDPRDISKTCERCGLQTLCRINEQVGLIDEPDAEETSYE